MVAIYARQSVDKKDSISIESQINCCLREAGETYYIYKDKGFSGKNIQRPAFQQMMRDVKENKISKIVVYRLDRFSRSIADFGRIWEQLQQKNVEFVSVNEKFDTTTPMGRAMLHIIMVFAQLERETTAQRIKDNYYERAKRGNWTGGPPPLGFLIDHIQQEGKKTAILKQNEKIQTVQWIFEQYAATKVSLGELAKKLNSTDKNKSWTTTAISRILHNTVYVCCDNDIYCYLKAKGIQILNAMEEFDGTKGGMLFGRRERTNGIYHKAEDCFFALCLHKGVVNSAVWLDCQKKLSHNSQIKNTGKGKYTWLSGLLKCGCCGYSLKIVISKNKAYFVCSGHTNYALCNQKFQISLKELENAIADEIKSLFSDCICPKKEYSQENLQQESKIREKINRLLDALSESSPVVIPYINEKIEKLEKELEILKREKIENNPEDTQQKGFEFDKLTFEQKKLTAKLLLSKVIIKGEEAEIQWNI